MSKKFALMTEEEIRRNYKQAADKEAQIGILAELNLCSEEDIQRVVWDGFEPYPVGQRKNRQTVLPGQRKHKQMLSPEMREQIALEHFRDGVSRKDLAEKYNLSITAVANAIKKNKHLQPDTQEPILEVDEEVAMLKKTLDDLYEAGKAKIEQVERESADYTQYSITKLRDGIVCIIEKDGIRVEIQKRTTPDREEVQV